MVKEEKRLPSVTWTTMILNEFGLGTPNNLQNFFLAGSMLADLLALDHDLVQCVELYKRVTQDDYRRQDPLEQVSDDGDPLLHSGHRQPDVDPVQDEDPGEDEVLEGQGGVHPVVVVFADAAVLDEEGVGDGEGQAEQ